MLYLKVSFFWWRYFYSISLLIPTHEEYFLASSHYLDGDRDGDRDGERDRALDVDTERRRCVFFLYACSQWMSFGWGILCISIEGASWSVCSYGHVISCVRLGFVGLFPSSLVLCSCGLMTASSGVFVGCFLIVLSPRQFFPLSSIVTQFPIHV